MNDGYNSGGIYEIGGIIVYVLTFFGTWIYCISEYGFLIGVGIGWLPSFIVAAFLALIWPLIALLLIGGLLLIFLYSSGNTSQVQPTSPSSINGDQPLADTGTEALSTDATASDVISDRETAAFAGLSHAVQTTLQRSISDRAEPRLIFANPADAEAWLSDMSERLKKHIPDEVVRRKLLTAIHYEATRAGLDPQLVIALIHVESGFDRYAVSVAGARGLMQVMPFWQQRIGSPEHNLFDINTGLRYGCTIFRHFLDMENGDYFRALSRWNPDDASFSKKVHGAWKKYYDWQPIVPQG